jgi:alkanesulfonate monooxygenase SsuD/methylene tetrahydromethanopterin reductase-like flavin-dependent oxidoreductase (luciferase family)
MYQMKLYGKWLAAGEIETSGQYRPDAEQLRKNAILGPPDRVTELMRKVIDGARMTEVALMMQFPGLEPRKAMRSLERFTTEVLPALRSSSPA